MQVYTKGELKTTILFEFIYSISQDTLTPPILPGQQKLNNIIQLSRLQAMVFSEQSVTSYSIPFLPNKLRQLHELLFANAASYS